MLTKIELTNFMSHAHTVIEPAAGLTVLVGPNNCGKSAVVEALQVLCRNSRKDYMLRHGESECAVTLTTDDGYSVEWRRKKRGATCYIVNGQKFDRLGGNVPDELHASLHLPLIAFDNDNFDIHFGEQKSPILSLLGSQSAAAKFFASSSDAIRLVEMQKRHKERLAERQREKNRLEAESRQLTSELEALAAAPAIDRAVREAEEEHSALLQLAADIERAIDDARRLDEKLQDVVCHSKLFAALAPLKPPVEPADTSPLSELIGTMTACERDASLAAAKVQSLANVPVTPALADTISLARCCTELKQQLQRLEHAEARHHALARLAMAPPLDDTRDLERLVVDLQQAQQAAKRGELRSAALDGLLAPPLLGDSAILASLVDQMTACLAQREKQSAATALPTSLQPPPTPIEVGHLADLFERLQVAAANVERQASQLDTAEQAVSEAAAALRAAATGSVCPLCGSEIDADRLLALSAGGGHVHG